MAKSEKIDVYERITNQIIASLEAGVAPWTCSWVRNGAHRNMVSGRKYRGINTLITWLTAELDGYSSNQWLTYRQATELGGQVRKGEKSTTLIAYNLIRKDKDGKRIAANAPKQEGEYTIPFGRGIAVFNRDQCDGLPEVVLPNANLDVSFAAAEEMIENYGITVEVGGDKACYSLLSDKVIMPDPARFKGDDAKAHYWAAAFHELVHSTGHESRLNRNLNNTFGSVDYAKEELIAEIGAAFLGSEFGLKGELQHENYIGSWLKELNDDKRFVVQAASKAQEAADYLLTFAPKVKAEEVGDNWAAFDALAEERLLASY